MERQFFAHSRSDSAYNYLKSEHLLPLSTTPHQSKIRVQTLLGHCLYRRVVLWTLTILFLVCVTLFRATIQANSAKLTNVDEFRIGIGEGQLRVQLQETVNGEERFDSDQKELSEEGEETASNGGSNSEGESKMPDWLKFPQSVTFPNIIAILLTGVSSLNGYFAGVKSLVSLAFHEPEFPNPQSQGPVQVVSIYSTAPPKQSPYRPHPDYSSAEYLQAHHPVAECFLDAEGKIPVPDLYAYDGVPQSQPSPAIGLHSLLGLRDDVCFDRWGRYGPYGLGYEVKDGGTGEGMDTERTGSEVVWERTGRIDYSEINWGEAQDRCFEANKHRFRNDSETLQSSVHAREFPSSELGPDADSEVAVVKLERTAVVIRTYVGFPWTHHAILNFRAMISELALKSHGEYRVHFLLHVKDDSIPMFSSPAVRQAILDANVPTEFHAMCTLWSERQMRLLYPGRFAAAIENPSEGSIHGVYRSAHLPLQVFAAEHPEYAHFWNWEMDIRYVGDYYELFDRIGAWAREQTRQGLWERSAKYYIPSAHGTWADFAALVANETRASRKQPILGPVLFPGRQSLRNEALGVPVMPLSCGKGNDPALCGVDEDADLVTLNPLFDAEDSGWVFAKDVTGYPRHLSPPPRRCAIVTASRLSRRLLLAMHEETWRMRHSMFSEMFPASVALHHGYKAVYAPHPVYLDRFWQEPAPSSSASRSTNPPNAKTYTAAIDKAFNSGRDGSTGGHGSPFDLRNEHNHKGTSWYYNSEFAGLLWRRWLGYAQMDGRGGGGGGRNGEGLLRGGRAEEEHPESSGRLCLRSMLVHPIKWENPGERVG
jgi:hypothetical protein